MTAVMTLVCDATTKSIQVVMSGAATTTNPDFTAHYADDTGGTFTEIEADGALNGVTPVTLVAAPAASTQRIVRTISIQNRDTAAVTLTISYNNNSTLRQLAVVTLNANDTWTTDGTFDSNGALKTNVVYSQGITLSSLEPYANWFTTTALAMQTATSASVVLWPYPVGQYVAARHMNVIFNETFSTAGTSSFRQTDTMMWGIYARGTSGNSTYLQLLTSSSLSFAVTYNNSTISVSQATTTNDTGYAYAQTTSAGLNISSGYTGSKLFQLLLRTTLAPNMYWLGFMNLHSSVNSNRGIFHSNVGMSETRSNIAPMGSFSSAFTSGSNQQLGIGGNWPGFMGSWTSAGQSILPATIAISQVSFGASMIQFLSFATTA